MGEIIDVEESEITVSLSTKEGQTSTNIGKIKGDLNSIIIQSENKVEIIIESEFEYLILQRKEFIGTKCFAIRNRTTTPVEDLHDIPSFDKFLLNEDLIVTIIGPRNSQVEMVFRLG